MTSIQNPKLEKVYNAKTREQSQAAYDEWSKTYEADLLSYGYRVAVVAATVWARFVDIDSGPILDAGCGTGLQSEPLNLAGFGPITGIDLSPGMLAIAKQKNIYAELHETALGEKLDFADDSFANTISVGTITPGHAPPNSFDELIRVTRKDGLIIFGMRVDELQDPAYLAMMAEYEDEGRWSKTFETDGFASMPLGEPDVINKVFVYKIN